jgi:antitoxin component YwqK of YwqJK toxin-antitoxin module
MGDNKEAVALEECYCDSLTSNTNNELVLNDNVFTGNCIANYPFSDQKYIEKQILNGKIHGKIIYYDKTGAVLIEEMYKNGDLVGNIGDNTNQCTCAELRIKKTDSISKTYLNDVLFSGHCADYFPDTEQLSLEANYNNGLLNGFTIFYKKNGNSLIIQEYENGKMLSEIFPQD